MKNTKNKNLFKEAIADAKNVSDAALANAKIALQEAFAPKLQSMISAKLSEDMENELDEEDYENNNYSSEEFNPESELDETDFAAQEYENSDFEPEVNEEFNLDELLAELESDEELNESEDLDESEELDENEDLDEAKKDDEDDDKPAKKDDSKPKAKKDDSKPKKDEMPEDVKELKKLIKSVVSDMLEDEEEEGMDGENMEPEHDDMMSGFDKMDAPKAPKPSTDVNLDELLAELESEDLDENEELEEVKAELNEAIKVIKILRNKINEINLDNSKLMYMGKVFKGRNLNESEKTKVLDSLDKATTPKEAKLIYETLQKNLTSKTINKKPIREHLGFASKTISGPKKSQIIEVDPTMARMQKLAGL
jgi:hypothetical protein